MDKNRYSNTQYKKSAGGVNAAHEADADSPETYRHPDFGNRDVSTSTRRELWSPNSCQRGVQPSHRRTQFGARTRSIMINRTASEPEGSNPDTRRYRPGTFLDHATRTGQSFGYFSQITKG